MPKKLKPLTKISQLNKFPLKDCLTVRLNTGFICLVNWKTTKVLYFIVDKGNYGLLHIVLDCLGEHSMVDVSILKLAPITTNF
jgi:hypothetical protein